MAQRRRRERVPLAHGPGPPARITVTGELDLAVVPAIERATDRLELAGAETVTIDLAGVTFTDSSALGWLLRLHRRCRAVGAAVVVVSAPDGPARRLLAASGVDQVLAVVDAPADGPPAVAVVVPFPAR